MAIGCDRPIVLGVFLVMKRNQPRADALVNLILDISDLFIHNPCGNDTSCNHQEVCRNMIHRFDPFYDSGWSSRPGAGPRNFMAADIYREEDRYLVAVDVPGVSEENTEVTVEKKTLTLTVDRSLPAGDDGSLVSRGRPRGTFTRRFYLGEGLDPDGIEATLENGVLTLAIPIVEAAKARKIEVGTIRNAITS